MVYYRALYPFESRSHDEITIQPGDVVMVRKMAARWQRLASGLFFALCCTIRKSPTSVKSRGAESRSLERKLKFLPLSQMEVCVHSCLDSTLMQVIRTVFVSHPQCAFSPVTAGSCRLDHYTL